MKISACWITKDECPLLVRSIESVRDIADEIIVVDTGSADDTVEVVTAMGAEVFHFEWIDDFSAARNFAIEKASGDIIIFLDSDEWFVPALKKEDAEYFGNIVTKHNAEEYMFILRNLNASGNVYSENKVTRMFLNRKDIRYVNKIHERLIKTSGKKSTGCFVQNWSIMHDGYISSKAHKKLVRNIKTLVREKYDNNDERESARLFYLFREFNNLGVTDKAYEYYNELLNDKILLKNLRNYPLLIREFLDYSLAIAFKKRQQISRKTVYHKIVKDAKKILPDYAGAACLKLVYMSMFDYKIDVFMKELVDFEKKYGEVDSASQTTDIYKYRLAEVYSIGAGAEWLRGNTPEAKNYAVKSVKTDKSFVYKSALNVILRSAENIDAANGIALITESYDTSNKKVLEDILNGLMYEKYKLLYLFFFKKQFESGTATKSRFIYLKVLLGRYGDAVQTAIENRNEIAESEMIETLFRAVVCSCDRALYEEAKEYLTGRAAILDAYFGRYAPDELSDDDKQIIAKEYGNITFAGGIKTGDRLLDVLGSDRVTRFKIKCGYYMDGGMYLQFFAEEGEDIIFDQENCSDASLMLAECYIGAGIYKKALEILRRLLEQDIINTGVLNDVLIIAEMADKPVKTEARTLYEKYIRILDEIIDLGDVINTGIVFEDGENRINKKSLKEIETRTAEQFEEILGKTLGVISDKLKVNLEGAADVYMEKGMYALAERCYRRLLASGYMSELMREKLAEVYVNLGNSVLAESLL